MKPIVFLLLFSTITFTQNNEKAGVVSGAIINGSKNDAPVAGQEVVLYTVLNGQEVDAPRPHEVSDAQGRFVFAGLDISENTAYYPMAVYQGIQYSGPLAQPAPDARQQQSTVRLFDTTTSDSAVSAAMHHVILEPAGGVLAVREVYQFTNRGNFTYIGKTLAGSDAKIGMQFELPQKAREIQIGGNLMACCTVIDENKVYDTMEFQPGSKQAVLNYQVPYGGSETELTKAITVQTAMLDVYVPESVKLARLQTGNSSSADSSAALTGAPFQLRGKNYLRYALTNVSKGSLLSLQLSQLPAAPRDFRWLAPVALVLIVVVGYTLYRKREKTAPDTLAEIENLDDPGDKRRELVNKILELDENYETGAIDKEVYQKEREKLMKQVLEIDARSQQGIATQEG